VKAASAQGIEMYGTGAGASPLIGGYFAYHDFPGQKISKFFKREPGSSIIYTTGYAANSSSLMSLLQKEDIAVRDMAVYASVFKGCQLTNSKRFVHNDLSALELILKQVKNKYRTKLVIVDGVYSQDGDIAPLKEIVTLAWQHHAFVMVDDEHGIGVIGKTGRGTLEMYELL
jgi:glycine C-acetyltransferase